MVTLTTFILIDIGPLKILLIIVGLFFIAVGHFVEFARACPTDIFNIRWICPMIPAYMPAISGFLIEHDGQGIMTEMQHMKIFTIRYVFTHNNEKYISVDFSLAF